MSKMVRVIWSCAAALAGSAFLSSGVWSQQETSGQDAQKESAQDAQAEVPKGDATKGEALYRRYCRGCHGEEGRGDGLVFMPHVNNLTKKGYIDTLPDSYLLLAIRKGGPGIGKSSYMPSFEETLTPEQMYDLIAYIRSLRLY